MELITTPDLQQFFEIYFPQFLILPADGSRCQCGGCCTEADGRHLRDLLCLYAELVCGKRLISVKQDHLA